MVRRDFCSLPFKRSSVYNEVVATINPNVNIILEQI